MQMDITNKIKLKGTNGSCDFVVEYIQNNIIKLNKNNLIPFKYRSIKNINNGIVVFADNKNLLKCKKNAVIGKISDEQNISTLISLSSGDIIAMNPYDKILINPQFSEKINIYVNKIPKIITQGDIINLRNKELEENYLTDTEDNIENYDNIEGESDIDSEESFYLEDHTKVPIDSIISPENNLCESKNKKMKKIYCKGFCTIQ